MGNKTSAEIRRDLSRSIENIMQATRDAGPFIPGHIDANIVPVPAVELQTITLSLLHMLEIMDELKKKIDDQISRAGDPHHRPKNPGIDPYRERINCEGM